MGRRIVLRMPFLCISMKRSVLLFLSCALLWYSTSLAYAHVYVCMYVCICMCVAERMAKVTMAWPL